ncbi:MAG: hypothetical protein ACE5H3_02805, partial [Planctomycetota bacterium]
MASNLFDTREFSRQARSPQGAALIHILLGFSMAPVLALAVLTSMKAARKNLFSGQGPEVFLAAPIPRARILLGNWGHLVLLILPWALALALPPVALAIYTLPFFLEAPASLLGRAAGGGAGADSPVFVFVLLAGPPLLLVLLAPFYARAYENEMYVANPVVVSAARGGTDTGWPSGPATSMFRKDFLHAWKAPRGLIGQLVMVAVIVYFSFNEVLENLRDPAAFANRVEMSPGLHPVPPQPLRHAAFLLLLIAILLAMVMPGITAALLTGERRQWALVAASPAPRKALLRGKLAWVFTLLGFYTLVVAGTGLFLRHLDVRGVLGFLAAVPPVLFAGVLVPLALQTNPWLVSSRPGSQPPVGRNMLGSFLSVGALFLMMLPGGFFWSQVEGFYTQEGGLFSSFDPRWIAPLGLALLWVFGSLVGGISLRFALAHFRRLT